MLKFSSSYPRFVVRMLCGAVLFMTAVSAAHAQFRNIPKEARSAQLSVGQFPQVSLNGEMYRLAPGARIFNENNMTVTPNRVPADVAVKYKLNGMNQVQTIWILSAKELAAPSASQSNQ